MTRTTAPVLIVATLLAAIVAWALETMLVMSGRPAIVPPIRLGLALGVLGVLPGGQPAGAGDAAHASALLARSSTILAASASVVASIVRASWVWS